MVERMMKPLAIFDRFSVESVEKLEKLMGATSNQAIDASLGDLKEVSLHCYRVWRCERFTLYKHFVVCSF